MENLCGECGFKVENKMICESCIEIRRELLEQFRDAQGEEADFKENKQEAIMEED